MITITFDKPVNPPKLHKEFLLAGFQVVELRLDEHVSIDTNDETAARAVYDAHIPETTGEKWTNIRGHRNTLLLACDWTQLPDVALALEEKQQWADYRQALRDITETNTDPDAVEFPTPPGTS